MFDVQGEQTENETKDAAGDDRNAFRDHFLTHSGAFGRMAQDDNAVMPNDCHEGGNDSQRKNRDRNAQRKRYLLFGEGEDENDLGETHKDDGREDQRGMGAGECGQPTIPSLKDWLKLVVDADFLLSRKADQTHQGTVSLEFDSGLGQ